MQGAVLDVSKRFPLAAGIAGVGLGLSALYFSVDIGSDYAEYAGGARAVGRVITADEDAGRDPVHAADVTWQAGGATRRALVAVWKYELPDERALDPGRRLHPGASLPLVLSTTDPNRAISARALRERAIFTLGGLTLAGVPFAAGMGFILILNPFVFAYLAREEAAASERRALDARRREAIEGGERERAESSKPQGSRPTIAVEALGDDRVLCVSFGGLFPPGSEGNSFASAMIETLRSEIARTGASGLVLDLTGLAYQFGDAVGGLAMPLLKPDKTFRPAAIVAQGETAEALRPLLEPRMLMGVAGIRMFATRGDARTHVERVLDRPQDA